jgi:hypothetical protein
MGEVMADDRLSAMLLEHEIRGFLHAEADLLDDRRFPEWLDLLAEDVRYWMPITRNVRHDQSALEYTREQQDSCCSMRARRRCASAYSNSRPASTGRRSRGLAPRIC